MRTEVKVVKKEFDKTEDDLKALQSVGQIIGEVLRQLDEERCAPPLRPAHLLICRRRRRRRRRRATAIALRAAVIVKASSGPRYVVGCRNKIEKAKLVQSTRVSLDMTTLTIMRALPREVDPVVFNMLTEDPGNVSYGDVGGAPPRSAQTPPAPRAHIGTCSPAPPARAPARPERADQGAARGDRAAAHQPRALRARGHQGAQGRAAVRAARHGQDLAAQP